MLFSRQKSIFLVISAIFHSLHSINVTNKTSEPVLVQLGYPQWKYATKQSVEPNKTISVNIPSFSRVNITDDYYDQALAEGYVNPADKTITSKSASVIIEKPNNKVEVKIQ